jgi:hypothetical protein
MYRAGFGVDQKNAMTFPTQRNSVGTKNVEKKAVIVSQI